MAFMWEFCQDFCRAMISHFHHVIFERRADITLFLLFHMLYWVMINSLIVYHFERWILLCFDFQCLLAADLRIYLLNFKRLLSIQLCFSCSVCCSLLIIFWLVWIECLSYMSLLLAWFASFLTHHYLFHSLFDCLWCSVWAAFFVYSSLLIQIDCDHQFYII